MSWANGSATPSDMRARFKKIPKHGELKYRCCIGASANVGKNSLNENCNHRTGTGGQIRMNQILMVIIECLLRVICDENYFLLPCFNHFHHTPAHAWK